MKRALQLILVIGVIGLTFSGYLSYRELFGGAAEPTCVAVGEPGSVLGWPPCVYGLVMYLAIVVIASVGLLGHRGEQARRAAFGAVI